MSSRAPAPPAARTRRRAGTADRFRMVAEFAPVMIWLASHDRKCAYVNRMWLDFTGLELDDALGSGWLRSVHPDDVSRCTSVIEQSFAAQQPFDLEFRIRRADGEYRSVLSRGVPLVDDGGFAGYVGSCVDVTARARAEARRDEQIAHERSARADAESDTLARDQFLAIVSHELRSPLNGIKSWTHVLESHLKDPDPMTRRALAGIMMGIEHQVHLIDDLLDVTRAMSGNLGLAKQPMALLPVLAEAVESMRAAAEEKGLALLTDYSMGDAEIHGDPDRVGQIFVNLLTNALKFTPHGGTIWVTARLQAPMLVVEVRDNGPGIPPEFLPYLFNPFRQAEGASSSRRTAGLGLGLALVQRLAELHGGYVTCDSEGAGRGSSFRVYLPVRAHGAPSITRSHAETDSQSRTLPSLQGVDVLLIDDQREARESVAELLRQAGARVHVAASGREALEHLREEGNERREVIVCDVAMPGEDGFVTLRHIREWEMQSRSAPRPAIALSAFTQREDRIRALAQGFQTHITKPVAPAELIAVVASADRGMRV